jgi:3-keto-5-aminohexanoate cleavage enzyme
VDPLIITATANVCWLKPEVPYPRTPEEIAAEARLCEERGATVCHTHADGRWVETMEAIRRQSGILVQCGMSSLQIEERIDVFLHEADMASIMLSHHDEAFVGKDFQLCDEHRVRPEFEVWSTGAIWNLSFLIAQGVVSPPYFTTLFFGWPGGTWSPPTVEEYLYRRRFLPEGCIVNVSIMGPEQIEILSAAIVRGDHVRVGTEDHPFRGGAIVPTHELVSDAADIARSVGRRVATATEARQIIGL